MKPIPSPYQLGATLYMPATRRNIAEIVLQNKIPDLRSLVICLEDAVSEQEIPAAIENLREIMQALTEVDNFSSNVESHRPLIFIRPRNEIMAKYLVANVNLSAIDGLVLPKFTYASLSGWWDIIGPTHLCIMPTLESEEVFDVQKMNQLADILKTHPCKDRIITLRIGGNDLMNVMSLRRSRDFTLYDGPMGYIIKMLVAVFVARGFVLTAPVCEHIDDLKLLEKELELDIAHGLVGKTAIHPRQITCIQQALRVSAHDHAEALNVLNSSKAVFKSQGVMCEPATHQRWAVNILERAEHYGIEPEAA
ncbi:HpcH/HpaI aldolase/citrate lyase family protein [Xenorhabdus anantnagensis]|uniref:HpcH/HpaI aldolase/citrate lyase family protein n=1 Tax=Xenorhabdus anantnagensis TaxID=3025875 RepID=A0ABT5LUM6_9GAMM|nr:HpcH/HpaI aldolase/citrate lyase family protein [Xenorhabdus anantnagensis]MDC9597456.1 HpcH/HpaI aldolase/citrate lyase family protein [Xenorhabdus anantnagensis]